MTLKRRAFLQRLTMTLTALGISESGLALLSDRYQQALAQPTRRKLALLVGINQYPESVCDCAPIHGAALNGCVTDVELQQELLIHRFGFQPSDILVLTDQAATRQGIEDAFVAHLVEQARPGDVVVVHLSGLGSQVRLAGENRVVSSLVPVDGLLPSAEAPLLNDLLDDTLQLLLRALPTEQITTILDAGFAPVGRTIQGNLRIRSRPNTPSGRINDAELTVQEQLRSRIARPALPRAADSFPGLLLSATSGNRVAAEVQWSGFSAGLFTYALTQQLWSTTPATTLRVAMSQVIGTVKQTAGLEQQPALSGQKAQRQGLPSDYFSTNRLTSADGVIRSVEEDGKVQLWLGGLPATVLENSSASLWSIVNPETMAPSAALLQLRSREGLTGKARLIPSETAMLVAAGQLVQEVVRLLPRNVGLTVALDASLERIERVDATSAFAPIARVTSVIAGEQPADVLFGRALPAQTLTASLPPQTLVGAVSVSGETATDTATPEAAPQPGSYGLFSLGRDAIPNTLIAEAEAVKTAVTRMTPQLKTLLAMKLLRLTVNSGSSCLGVRATLETLAPQERLIMQQETSRAPWQPPTSKVAHLLIEEATSTLTIGSQLQYRLLNYSDRPVYFLVLGIDSSGKAVLLQPPQRTATSSSENGTLIAPGDTVIVPPVSAADWLVQGPPGLAESYIVFSRLPFEQTEQVLQVERSPAEAHRILSLSNPLDVVQALLQDLHQASSDSLPTSEAPADSYRLDVNAWATLSFVYQVVPA